jgi:hypothetical protein
MTNRFHHLKSWPEFYQDITAGHKTHEMRRNDRDYKVGDVLVLCEYDPTLKRYTGRSATYQVMQITPSETLWRLHGIETDIVIMSIEPFECAHEWNGYPVVHCVICGLEKTE